MTPPSPVRAPRPWRHVEQHRVRFGDGAATTLHVAWYRRGSIAPRVVRLPTPAPLQRWCRDERVGDALVGGFYVRPHGEPLGELWIGGERLPHHPFEAPFGALRACVEISRAGAVAVARRDELPDAAFDRLQAGPLLLRDGAYAAGADPEGFSTGAGQFDSDITAGRYPRTALGLAGDWLAAAVCDGRADDEAGMTFAELAGALRDLGATDAINLDGGGSSSLVCDGRLVNVPRERHGITLLGGRPVTTAITFTAR